MWAAQSAQTTAGSGVQVGLGGAVKMMTVGSMGLTVSGSRRRNERSSKMLMPKPINVIKTPPPNHNQGMGSFSVNGRFDCPVQAVSHHFFYPGHADRVEFYIVP